MENLAKFLLISVNGTQQEQTMTKGELNELRAFDNLSKVWKQIKRFKEYSKDDREGFDGRIVLSNGLPCRYQVKSSMYYCKKFMLHEAWERIKKFTALILIQGSELTFVHLPERMEVDLPRLKRLTFTHFIFGG